MGRSFVSRDGDTDALASMRIFVAVIEHGSMSAAARAINSSPAVISKRIAMLEKMLGVLLMVRTTRALEPTEAGMAYYRSCVEIIRSVAVAHAEIRRFRDSAIGCLRLRVESSCATSWLAHHLQVFHHEFPDVDLEIRTYDPPAFPDIMRCDLMIVLGELPEIDAISVRIGERSRSLYVSNAGPLLTPFEVPWLGDGIFARYGKQFHSPGPSASLSLDDFATAKSLAEAGLGAAVLFDDMAQDAVKRGTLTRLDSVSFPPLPVRACYHSKPIPEKTQSMLRVMRRNGAVDDTH